MNNPTSPHPTAYHPHQKEAAATFPLFPLLPTELRHQIWQYALPPPTHPPSALLPHRKNCWVAQPIPYTGVMGQTNHPHANYEIIFDMSLLDHVQIYTPLLHVNSEARAIARKWGQRVSIPPRDRITGNQSEDVSSRKEICPFSRPFDINRDYLYLVPDNIVDLILGASDRLEQPDMNGKATRVVFSLPTVVLSEEVIWLKDAELMEEILDLCSILGLVYIVVGEQPKWKRGGVQRWWGVEWVAKRAFVWQWMENRFVEMGGGSRFESEEVYRRMVDWCGCMGRVLKRDHKTRFEVRVVRAVKQ